MPIAYSYQRFSSEEQRKGTSLERQSAAAERYIAENPQFGLVLDRTMTMVDDGISAYRGRNLKEGALGLFVDAVKDGKIPEGSWLLLESLDRFTRQQVNIAAGELLNLINRGIVVVTLNNGNIYRSDDYSDGSGLVNLIGALIAMQGHHAEQVQKGRRVAAAWAIKRQRIEQGHILTRHLPFWLTIAEGRIVAMPDRVSIVKEVFTRRSNGEGKAAIANDLTRRRVPTAKGHSDVWHASAIEKLLRSDAVVGRLKTVDGTIYENYFPTVVDESLFQSVQALRGQKGSVGASVGSHALAGIVKHSCGQTLRRVNKGDGYPKFTCLMCRVSIPFRKALEAAEGALFQLQYVAAPTEDGEAIHSTEAYLTQLREEQTEAFERFRKTRAFETRKLYEALTKEIAQAEEELASLGSRNTLVLVQIENSALERKQGLQALKSVLVSAEMNGDLSELTIKTISGKTASYRFSDNVEAL